MKTPTGMALRLAAAVAIYSRQVKHSSVGPDANIFEPKQPGSRYFAGLRIGLERIEAHTCSLEG